MTDHIVHLVLSMYALGASPGEIRAAYDRNKSYQRPAYPADAGVVKGMHDQAKFRQYFHKEEHYSNYLVFFQEEIDAKGVGDVLNEYVFKGDERGESMLSRLFGGRSTVHCTLVRVSLMSPRTRPPSDPSRLRAGVQPACHCGSSPGAGSCPR